MNREPWYVSIDWAGAVVMVLALGVSLSMIVGIFGAVFRQSPISEARAQLFTTLFGAAIGAIASYLGMARARQHRIQASEEAREEIHTAPEPEPAPRRPPPATGPLGAEKR